MRKVLIVLVFILTSFSFAKEAEISAKSVAFSYYETIYNDKFDDTLKLIKFDGKKPTEATFKTLKIYFKTHREWAKEQGGIKEIVLYSSFTLPNHMEHMKFEILYKNGSKDKDEIELVRDGKTWKVFYFLP